MVLQEQFGAWQLKVKTRVLHHGVYPDYEIDLDKIKKSADVLDWIFQLQEKTWVTDAHIADFARCIRYLFGRRFCGSGSDGPIDIRARLRDLGAG
jgi:hypothetical protein